MHARVNTACFIPIYIVSDLYLKRYLALTLLFFIFLAKSRSRDGFYKTPIPGTQIIRAR